MTTRSAAPRRHLPNSPFNAQPDPVIERFAVDDRVTHDLYGLGVVLAEEDSAVTIDFGSQRVRIPSPFAKLTKL